MGVVALVIAQGAVENMDRLLLLGVQVVGLAPRLA
jgi:hypothetical protein